MSKPSKSQKFSLSKDLLFMVWGRDVNTLNLILPPHMSIAILHYYQPL